MGPTISDDDQVALDAKFGHDSRSFVESEIQVDVRDELLKNNEMAH